MKTIFDELQQEVKNWWISLILGILSLVSTKNFLVTSRLKIK